MDTRKVESPRTSGVRRAFELHLQSSKKLKVWRVICDFSRDEKPELVNARDITVKGALTTNPEVSVSGSIGEYRDTWSFSKKLLKEICLLLMLVNQGSLSESARFSETVRIQAIVNRTVRLETRGKAFTREYSPNEFFSIRASINAERELLLYHDASDEGFSVAGSRSFEISSRTANEMYSYLLECDRDFAARQAEEGDEVQE